MKKLRIMVVLIMILPTWWSNLHGTIKRDFRDIAIGDLRATLIYPAPRNIFIVYKLNGGYRLINDYFWEKINLKLNNCKSYQEIVTPVKDRIIEKKISWWQKEKSIFIGGSIVFTIGAILGAYVRGK